MSVKNLALVAGILVSIFLLHLVFLSGTEAYKMLKVKPSFKGFVCHSCLTISGGDSYAL